jgi:NAD(P)-dependent dehydrogenase (short-subunit alcohol dehydrogenase family)
MTGKTVVITGGTSGIGEIAAIELAQMSARIALIARDTVRARVTLALASRKRSDVMINNAWAMCASRRLTEDQVRRSTRCQGRQDQHCGGLSEA